MKRKHRDFHSIIPYHLSISKNWILHRTSPRSLQRSHQTSQRGAQMWVYPLVLSSSTSASNRRVLAGSPWGTHVCSRAQLGVVHRCSSCLHIISDDSTQPKGEQKSRQRSRSTLQSQQTKYMQIDSWDLVCQSKPIFISITTMICWRKSANYG